MAERRKGNTEQAAMLYRAGMTPMQIARRMEVTDRSVHRMLNRAGVERRPAEYRGGYRLCPRCRHQMARDNLNEMCSPCVGATRDARMTEWMYGHMTSTRALGIGAAQ